MRRLVLLVPLLLVGCRVDDADFSGTCQNTQTQAKYPARVVRRGGEVEMWQYHDQNGFTQTIYQSESGDWQCDENAKPPQSAKPR